MEQKNKGFTRPQGIRLSETKREDSDAVKAGVFSRVWKWIKRCGSVYSRRARLDRQILTAISELENTQPQLQQRTQEQSLDNSSDQTIQFAAFVAAAASIRPS